jgi:capsid protein
VNWLQKKALGWVGLSYLVDAANWRDRFRRPFEPLTTNTIGVEINQYDWYQLLSDSRKLYCNLGPVTGAIDDKATYSVGRAWNAKYTGKDKAWGEQAEKWVNEMWYPMADARGPMFDFKTDLFLESVSIDRDGEIYIYLTESPDGWPQIQLLPAHLIGDRDRVNPIIESGPYKGLRQSQGVITNDVGQAVAYNVLGTTPQQDEIISAVNLIQVFDPRWADQIRGFPVFMHALLDLRDLRQIQGYEKIAAELMSSIGIMEWNETGAPDLDPNTILRGTPYVGPNPMPGVTVEQLSGGGNVKYFRGNSGSKLEQLKNERPSVQLDAFMNRLIRNACVGAGWPYELTWDAAALGGANVRLLIAKAMRAVEDRQDLLRPVARRCVGYAVAKAIKKGLLPPNDEWYAWRFTMPARMTADYGREAAADLADLNAGIRSLSDILGEEGKDVADHAAERKRDNEVLAAYGLPEVGVAAATTVNPMDALKGKMDAYGVGVRAGAITPQKDDESAFRKEFDLPPPGGEVEKAWKEDEGVRRPITLQIEGQPAGPQAVPRPDSEAVD